MDGSRDSGLAGNARSSSEPAGRLGIQDCSGGGAQRFSELLEHVKAISEMREIHRHANSEVYLSQLEKTADDIRGLLRVLGKQSDSKNNSVINSESVSKDEEEIYQNYGPHMRLQSTAKNDTDTPPPLPPRLPRRQAPPPPKKHSAKPTPNSSSSTSTTSLRSAASVISYKASQNRPTAPVEERLQKLNDEREHLIKLLQDEARERERFYAELEVIAQNIRRIPLPSAGSYSLDNEAERQKHELRAQRIQEEMVQRLGSASDGLERRNARVNALKRVEAQIAELTSNNKRIMASSRQQQQPRSANLEQLYHEALPIDKGLSHSGPSAFGVNGPLQDDSASVMSFTSSIHSLNQDSCRRREDIDSKIECVNSLVSLLGCTDVEKMSRTFLAMSSTPANCDLMRSHRVVPLLVQLLHENRPSKDVRLRVAKALHNIVHAHPEQKQCKREAKVLRLLEILRMYADFLRDLSCQEGLDHLTTLGCCPLRLQVVPQGQDSDLLLCDTTGGRCGLVSDEKWGRGDGPEGDFNIAFPCHNFVNYSADFSVSPQEQTVALNIEETMAVLTRCSFDESHRQPIFLLGGIPALAELIQIERQVHGELSSQEQVGSCTEVRRYAVVALTNLTFGNAGIKSFLCSFNNFIEIMVAQLASSASENLRKATAHLFRNLAWKADKTSKQILSESSVVTVLMKAAMEVATMNLEAKEEPTLKVILSALWNLSAHCRKNKADICTMDGALAFLVALLKHKATSIVENGGGILRNISSYIATSPDGEEYRAVLRQNHCLEVLLQQLKSSSLTIVSNACGTLWNFSARCPEDQQHLWELGAVPMLQSLTNSKHKTISTCSLAALKNLYAARPSSMLDMVSKGSSSGMPSLQARKRRNMVKELDDQLKTDIQDDSNSSSNSEGEEEEEEEQTPSLHSTQSEPYGGQQQQQQPLLGQKRFEGQFTNYLKPYTTPALVNNYVEASSNDSFVGQLLSPSGLPHVDFGRQASKPQEEEHEEEEEEENIDDPPTDYSLRFQEEEASSNEVIEGAEATHEVVVAYDSVKSYYTEDTPYDTPFMISSAPSVSDLHEEDEESKEAEGADKPQVYCTEGTPACFSRADSLSSLSSNEDDNDEHSSVEKGQLEAAQAGEKLKKTVTFRPEEQTPLMFSPSSSLESLNSFDQHSIRTGYSSCDFSRVTSGRVSPSDLPDSPCQSRPYSPNKRGAGFLQRSKEPKQPKEPATTQLTAEEAAAACPTTTTAAAAAAAVANSTKEEEGSQSKEDEEFKDTVKTYKEEGTPAVFSSRASLSDDGNDPIVTPPVVNENDAEKAKETVDSDEDDSDEEDQDADALLASLQDLGKPVKKPEPSAAMRRSGIPRNTGIPMRSHHNEAARTLVFPTTSECGDAVKRYCTEDTPVCLSKNGSNTNLSALTVEDLEEPQQTRQPLDDTGSSSDNDAEALLQGCIKHAWAATNKSPQRPAVIPRPQRSQMYHHRQLGERSSGEGIPTTQSERGLGVVTTIPCPTPAATTHRHGRGIACSTTTTSSSSTASKPRHSSTSSNSGNRPPPPPPKRQGSTLSSASVETQDQVRVYQVEDTPINFSNATSFSDLTVDEPQESGRVSVDSDDGLIQHHIDEDQSSLTHRIGVAPVRRPPAEAASRQENPICFATENTPTVFSQNESLSSLSCDEEADGHQHRDPTHPVSRVSKGSTPSSGYRSFLPRPQVSGRSESSASSTKSKSPHPDDDDDNDNNKRRSESDSDDEDLLASCINSGMPKSRSEPVDLRGKLNGTRSQSALGGSKVKRRDKSDKKPRSKSKSPRNSRVIVPGLRITELKLVPPSPPPKEEDEVVVEPTATTVDDFDEQSDKEVEEVSEEVPTVMTLPLQAAVSGQVMAVSEMWADVSPNVAPANMFGGQQNTSLEDTLTASRVLEMEANKVAMEVESMEDSLTSSVCSTLSTIQPPSMMESLISMSERRSSSSSGDAKPLQRMSSSNPGLRLECRHTLSAKKGHVVPEMVRRALGQDDMASSQSSCQSNLDNIKPPTLLEDADLDNSILSIASISSEVADCGGGKPMIEDASEVSTNLADIGPPSAMDEVSGVMSSLTLVADNNNGQTYTIEGNGGNGDDQSTCQDITDVFDESQEPTLTLGSSDQDVDEAPELPRDSRESSRESTPQARRKQAGSSTCSLLKRELEMARLRTFTAAVPSLDEADVDLSQQTSGYKSADSPRTPSRQRRKEDSDRFKTHTITKDDLTGSSRESSPKGHHRQLLSDSSSGSSSPGKKSLRQRRSEEAERFRTQTITPAAVLLQQGAKEVMDAITESKAAVRSRSASAEILDDDHLEREALESPKTPPTPRGPRIRKPDEIPTECTMEEAEVRSVRGRRKGLYSTPPKRSTVPPAIAPKPVIAPKPRHILSAPSSNRSALIANRLGSPRGTRATSLRQATRQQQSPPPPPPQPMTKPRLTTKPPLASPANSTCSSGSNSSRLVRQGTFTKEEPTNALVDIDITNTPPKPAARSIPPTPQPRSSAEKSPRGPPMIAQTRTSALRERSRSRQGSGSSSSNSSVVSSTKSSRSNIRTSNSSQSLKVVNESGIPRRTPSSTNIDCGKSPIPKLSPVAASTPVISDTCSESAATSKKGHKKEVTSRIASLWKKVEDSKKKDKGSGSDKRVWISKGKVIPENERALLKQDEQQKKIISDFQASQKSNNNSSVMSDASGSIKPRAKSRLSMKLAKFTRSSSTCGTTSSSKKETPTNNVLARTPTNPTISSSTPVTTEDRVNGNAVQTEEENQEEEEENKVKRMSRVGSFFNPEDDSQQQQLPRAANNRSPAPASAIVPPFNYNPPERALNSKELAQRKLANAAVRRNDSYVSSMGRNGSKGDANNAAKPKPVPGQRNKADEDSGAPTSSVLVTLV